MPKCLDPPFPQGGRGYFARLSQCVIHPRCHLKKKKYSGEESVKEFELLLIEAAEEKERRLSERRTHNKVQRVVHSQQRQDRLQLIREQEHERHVVLRLMYKGRQAIAHERTNNDVVHIFSIVLSTFTL